MKYYFFGFLIFLGMTLFFLRCNEKEKKPSVSSQGENVDTCEILNSYYERYVSRIKEIQKERGMKNTHIIAIDKEIGDAYISAYEAISPKNQTLGIKLDIETIAFFYKYLLNHPGDSLAVHFARYSKDTLDSRGLIDINIEKPENVKKINRYAMVFGVVNNKRNPFIIPGLNPFYDDWNQEWP